MSKSAFVLRSEYDGSTEGGDPFTGGTLTVAGVEIDVAGELERGSGAIVVEDAQQELVDQLAAYPALKRAKVPEGARAIIFWELMPRLALNEEAERRGLEGYSRMGKPELASVLQLQDQRRTEPPANGDDVVAEDLRPGADAREISAEVQDAAPADTGKPAGRTRAKGGESR